MPETSDPAERSWQEWPIAGLLTEIEIPSEPVNQIPSTSNKSVSIFGRSSYQRRAQAVEADGTLTAATRLLPQYFFLAPVYGRCIPASGRVASELLALSSRTP